MLNFVAHQNIEHFRRRLDEAADPEQRRAILLLLEAEIDKLPIDEQMLERRPRSTPGPAG